MHVCAHGYNAYSYAMPTGSSKSEKEMGRPFFSTRNFCGFGVHDEVFVYMLADYPG